MNTPTHRHLSLRAAVAAAAALLLSLTHPAAHAALLPEGTDSAAVNRSDNPEQSYRQRTLRAYLPIENQKTTLKMERASYFENPLGIHFRAGEQITLTITGGEGQELRLIVHDFTRADEKWFNIVKIHPEGIQKSIIEELPTHSEYELKEGPNTLTLRTGGLGYLHYRSADPAAAPPITLRIEGGTINGLITPADGPQAYRRTLANAQHELIDLIGERAHLIFPVSALRQACPDNGPGLISLYDRLLTYLQDDIMGLSHYRAHTGAHMLVRYLNDRPMCAGETAAFFPKHSFPAQASIRHLITSSWGAAHELGHLHQTRPGMMWIGTVEVTNNLFSAYVNYKFTPHQLRLEHSTTRNSRGEAMPGGIFDCFVNNAITHRRLWQFQGGALPGGPPNSWEDTARDVFTDVVPLWQLLLYRMEARGQKDFYPQIFDNVRHTDETHLTQGELRVLFFKRACDAARLDLSEFFVKTGILAPIDRMVNDYSHAHMTITPAMCREAMHYAATHYPKPDTSVIHYINANNLNLFRDKTPLRPNPHHTLPPIKNGRIELPEGACPGAVAFEAYRGNTLLHISLLGLGHSTLGSATTIICPPGTDTIKAVQWDGTRHTLLGSSTTPPEDPLDTWLTRTNGIYSLHEAAAAGHEQALRARLTGPQVRHNQYGQITQTDSPADPATIINTPNEHGNTPLHLAAAAGHRHIITLLLEHGSDKNARNRHNQRPADLAPAPLNPLLE